MAGLVIGLSVGPTGAAMIGFKLPYLRLSVPEGPATAAQAPPPVPAPAAPRPAAPVAATPTPVQPVAMTPIKPQPMVLPAGRPLTIGVFGDSMADGLWAALYRDLRKDGQVEVMRFARNSTGLARYDYVDVQAQTQAQLAQHHVDIAVIMFGTNDGQAILDSGRIMTFATPEWRATYTARIDSLVGLLRGQGATVYWVGLPKMEKDYFDKRASFLNTIFQERAAALNMPFISTVPQSVDDQGNYEAYLTGPGDAHAKRLMRAADGIHMTMAGYLRIAEPVQARIIRDMAAATATPVAGQPRPGPMTPAAAPMASAPYSGQYMPPGAAGAGVVGPMETAAARP